jgi:hypothetical protein
MSVWRRASDAGIRLAGPRLERLVASEHFATGMVLVFKTRKRMHGRYVAVTSAILHLGNLPTKHDMDLLLTQMSKVDRRVRELSKGQDIAAPNEGSG